MKHEQVGMNVAAEEWRGQIAELERLVRRLPRDRVFRLTYDALCRDPKGSLKALLEFVMRELEGREADSLEPVMALLRSLPR